MKTSDYLKKTAIFLFIVFGFFALDTTAQTLNCGGIGGTIRSQNVTIPQRGGGGALQAKIFAPNAALQTAPCPLIAILPGGGGSPISTVEWAALRLAASGYVVIAVKPELPNSTASYDNGARSGIDYAVSASNPYLSSTNTGLIGVAGWSLGAFALSITQEQDTRVKAYIGWDNLVTGENGDAGASNCVGTATVVRTPRVPAMGQASETCNDGRSADAKKTAFEHWKTAGQPTMEVVIKNATHFWWSDSGTVAQHDLLHYYTQGWFDRWLKQDASATARLTARTVNGTPVSNLLSSIFRSAAFLDGYNCGDFLSSCPAPVINSAKPFDFDGDGKTDISIFRPNVGEWWINRSSNVQTVAAQFGNSSDKIAPADFTGDGKTDIALWRPSTGEWFILRSEDSSFFSFPFGTSGDIPAPSDYDGDGRADAAVFRPSTATWFVLRSGGGFSSQQFGVSTDVPVAADYDGDGKTDIAIFRPVPAEWWYQRSSDNQVLAAQFGSSADKPVQGDYTGDGRADIAVFRPSNGFWFILRSEDGSFFSLPFGTTGDIPSPGDYDGDGKFDTTVFRPSTNTWFSNRSSAGVLIANFGTSGDVPVPAAFVP